MRHPSQTVELHVVAVGHTRQAREGAPAQCQCFFELRFEIIDRSLRRRQQFGDALIRVFAPGFDPGQPVAHPCNQRVAAFAVAQQVVLDVRIALDDPHVAEHFVEHFCRAPGAALRAQCVEQIPALSAEQPDHDLAVGERSVVVGDFPEAGGHGDNAKCEVRSDE